MKATLKILLPILAVSLIAFSCTKDEDQGQTQLKIRLTDNPFDATEVNVEILKVRVNLSDDSSGWRDLDTYAGVYNLLELQNGVDTLLAQGTVPTGTLKEIRFVLGDENSIMIENVLFPLTIPSGGESGLKIKLNRQLNASIDSLQIDFDAEMSILQTGTGEYKLKPVLKIN